MFVKVIQLIFVGVFLSILAVSALFASGVVAHFLMLGIRVFKPQFGMLKRPETAKAKEEAPAKVRLVAIDFLLAEKRRVLQAQTRAQHETLNPQFSKLVREGTAPQKMEWTLEELAAQLNRNKREKLEERRDRWAIAIFPHGLKCPYWLIDFTTKGGKRREPVYAPLRDKRRTFDLASAERWCESLEGSPMILAANAQARIQVRLRQAATRLWEQRQESRPADQTEIVI